MMITSRLYAAQRRTSGGRIPISTAARHPPWVLSTCRSCTLLGTSILRRTQQRWSSNYNNFDQSPFENGFIPLKENEGLLCFTNILPTKRGRFDFWSRSILTSGVRHIVESRCLPPELKDPKPNSVVPEFEILDVIPRSKDGIVFLKYRPGPPSCTTNDTATISEADSVTSTSTTKPSSSSFSEPSPVAAAISKHLRQHPVKRWFLFLLAGRQVKVFDTRGDPGPWLADLRRYPGKRLRFEFLAGPGFLGQQALYALCSRYGKIADIIPQSPTSRRTPRYTSVQFTRVDSAVAAKACLDGHIVDEMEAIYGKEGGVRLSVSYERIPKLRWVRDLLMNHPKFVVPAIIAVIITIAIASFETARVWFVWAKITGFPNNLVGTVMNINPAMEDFSDFLSQAYHNQYAENSLQNMGKKSTAAEKRKKKLETALDNGIMKLQDQLTKMLVNDWLEDTPIVVTGDPAETKLAIRKVLDGRSVVFHLDFKPIADAGSSGDAAVIYAVASQLGYPVFAHISRVLDFIMHIITGRKSGLMKSLDSEVNSMLESAKTVLREVALEAQKQSGPEHPDSPIDRPVVVIHNISRSKNTNVYRKLEEWASDLANEHYAHVILLTNDHNIMQSRRHRDITYNEHTNPNAQAVALKRARISRDVGKLPEEILTRFVLQPAANPRSSTWTPEQAWEIIKLFSERTEVNFEEILLADLFQKNGESSLRALEKAGMITIGESRGMPDFVKPSKKYHQEVFVVLARDRFLAAKMDLNVAKALREQANAKILEVEKELARLAKLKILPKGREEYLLKKIDAAQEKLEDHERRIRLSTSNLKKFFRAS